MNVQEILSQYVICAASSPTDRRKIEAKFRMVRLRDGDPLTRQGDKINDVVFLGSGQVRVFLVGPGGREVTLYRLSPGELCTANVLAAMNGGISYISAAACGPTEMASLPAPEFKRLFASDASVQDLVFRALSERTETLLSLIEGITFVRMETRVADYLIKRSIVDENGEPIVNATHADIAMDLGSAREVVSRVLKNFKARGAVDVARKQIKLLHTGLLENIRAYG